MTAACTWLTGTHRPERELALVHIIRADDDPQRLTREQAKAAGRNRTKEWRALARKPVPELAELIRELLGDGRPRTFNAICVELFDSTADVLFQKNPDHALWSLVAAGEVEHECCAPVRFRLARTD